MNKTILMGRLTRDVELKYTQSQLPVATFNLAVNRRFVKEDTEKKTDFFQITAWNKTAEFCSKYFKKGQQVGIIGRLEQQEWTNEEGKKQTKVQVIAEEVYFAGEKKEGSTSTEISDVATFNQAEFNFSDEDDLPF